jgi:hypothetical protein
VSILANKPSCLVLLGFGVLSLFASCGDEKGGSEVTAIQESTNSTSTDSTTSKEDSGTTTEDTSSSSSENTTSIPSERSEPPAWSTSTLISTGAAGQYSTVATDSSNKVHAAYYFNNGSGDVGLGHITNASGSFVSETVDAIGVGESISIALDDSDGIHISYYATDSFDLKYAYKALNATTWMTRVIDADGTTGQYNAVAVDANKVHVVYGDITSGALKYATNTIAETDSWDIETIDSSATGQVHASLAVDTARTIYIAYRSDTSTLKYVTGTAGAWSTPVTVDSGGAISDTSIALNSDGKVYISYYLGGETKIKIATNVTGSWVVQLIEESFSASQGKHTSIVIDAHDDIFISYYKESTTFSALKAVVNIDGVWKDQTIEEAEDEKGIGKYSSLAIDQQGKLHIVYYVSDGSDLKYATESGP